MRLERDTDFVKNKILYLKNKRSHLGWTSDVGGEVVSDKPGKENSL